MTASLLMSLSALLIGLLGTGHLLLTFRGPKLLPRDRDVKRAMERVSPVITARTTIWKARIGFNASHSMGAMLFGLVYGSLALQERDPVSVCRWFATWRASACTGAGSVDDPVALTS